MNVDLESLLERKVQLTMRGGQLKGNADVYRYVGRVINAYDDCIIVRGEAIGTKEKGHKGDAVIWRKYIMSIDILDETGFKATEDTKRYKNKSLGVPTRIRHWLYSHPKAFSTKDLILKLGLKTTGEKNAMYRCLCRMTKARKIKRLGWGFYMCK